MSDPIKIFSQWFEEAKNSSAVFDATAMTLATADKSGKPSLRAVLLKGFDERGFVFYTNMESRKSLELKANPQAALCFLWQALGYQVRIEGTVTEVSGKEADEYFNSRPLISRIGAIISKQSKELDSHAALIQKVKEAEKIYSEQTPPKRPANWSGWRLMPSSIEFWQQGEYRLHERDIYMRTGNSWTIKKLYP